jgi:hypothetical protein
MLPPIPTKQLLYFRAIAGIVLDKIATEAVEPRLFTAVQISSIATPENAFYLFIIAYMGHTY